MPYWSVAKWVGKIRSGRGAEEGKSGNLSAGLRSQQRPTVLLGDREANHFGRGGTLGPLVEASIENAFLIKTTVS